LFRFELECVEMENIVITKSLRRQLNCRNPILKECEDETHTLEMGTWESSRTPEISEFNCRGQNTSHCGVFYIIGKIYQSVNVENGLA
jgi:hypothetical protein